MLKDSESVSFVATLDSTKSRAFYEGVLGLTFVADEFYALVFELDGHMLRIAKVDELVPAVHTVLGWHVSDISTTVESLSTRGVLFARYNGMDQDEFGVWVSPSGAKVAWFKDPDGNNLSLTQLPTE